MFDVDAYLRRIGYSGPGDRTPETLRILHKRHLVSVAFDNGESIAGLLAPGDMADVGADSTFDKIVRGGRGGNCTELNGLFRRLLQSLGFDTIRIAAGVMLQNGSYSPDLSHVFTGVRLGGELWLVDVGFSGPSFLEPLRLTAEVQHQYGCAYRAVERGGYHVLCRRARNVEWHSVYRFKLRDRPLAEWDGFWEKFEELSQGLPAAGVNIRSRATEVGQLILAGKLLREVDDGYEKVRALMDPTEYREIVDRITCAPPTDG